MPNLSGSLACGIRKVRVAAVGAPALAKPALSQVVAATFGRAGTGFVPTQGLLIFPTTGRSATARVPRVSPEGGGSTRVERTLAGHGPDGSASQRSRTAIVSMPTARGM